MLTIIQLAARRHSCSNAHARLCSARLHAAKSLLLTHKAFCLTLQKDTLILYGGEWFDGAADKTYVYGDLYLYDAAKDRWKKVIVPNG